MENGRYFIQKEKSEDIHWVSQCGGLSKFQPSLRTGKYKNNLRETTTSLQLLGTLWDSPCLNAKAVS